MRPALAEGDALRPGPYDPLIAKFVQFTVANQHVDTPAVDDAVSARWLDNYLDTIDPQHWYFLQSDVEEFREAYGTKLDDDLVREPQLEAAFVIYERFQQRVQERLTAAREMLDQPVDFTAQETLVWDRSDEPWPLTEAEAKELWRKSIKNELIAARLNETPEAEALDLLRKRYERLERTIFETEVPDVREQFLNALTTLFDPHSNYWSPESNEDFQIELSNQLEGIGAVLTSEDGYTTIKEVVVGGPADRSDQLQAGDKIVAVAQGNDEPVDVVEMQLDKVVQLIRGPKGTKVNLTIIPGGTGSTRKVVSITRDKVELLDRLASQKVHDVTVDGKELKLGVLTLPSFYAPTGPQGGRDASDDVAKAIAELKAEQVDGIVLDLRHNGGGSLNEAVQIGGLFIDQGPIVQVGGGPSFPTEVLRDTDRGVAWDGPLVVLTSPLSASASEIVAGAIQDYGRGVIVGSKQTHGKGSVQTVIELDPLLEQRIGRRLRDDVAGALKLTTQKFYRVTGGSTQFKGVAADVVIPTPYDGADIYEADLENALKWDEIAGTPFQPVGSVTKVLPELTTRSKARVAQDTEFKDLQKRLDWWAQQKDRKESSLVLADRQAEAEARKAIFPDEQEDGQVPEPGAADDGPDPMRDEALHILGDYITLTG